MEAASGVEPLYGGFAIRCLTTWLRRLAYVPAYPSPQSRVDPGETITETAGEVVERETGLEPATSTLARWSSTN